MIQDQILVAILVALSFLYTTMLILAVWPRRSFGKKFNPPVSVIIPAYNEEKNIEATVKSVLSADYPNDREIIIVDDGSKDRTAQIVKKLSKKNKIVRLVKGMHQGKAKAINLGMRNMKNDFFIVLDADTEIEKNSIVELVLPFSKKKIAAIASTIRVRKSSKILTWFQHFEYANSMAFRYVSDKINGVNVVPGFCAFRKSAMEKIGGFKGDTAVEDLDVCFYLKKAGYEITMAPKSVAYTRVPESLNGWFKQRIRWAAGTFQVLGKHRKLLFKKSFSGISFYTVPTQIYWFIHSFLYLPIVLYQISNGFLIYYVQKGLMFSSQSLIYFVKWFAIIGMAEFIYNVAVGVYPASLINLLSITVFSLSYSFGIYAIVKFSKLNIYNLLGIIFFFPYVLLMLSANCLGIFHQIATFKRGEKWEKSF